MGASMGASMGEYDAMGRNETTVIDMYAGLRRLDPGALVKGGRSKFVIEFRAPDLTFTPSEWLIAGTVALAITETVRGNLLAGRDPTGGALPAIGAETKERRAYRLAQSQRDGSLSVRINRDKDMRRKGRKNFRRRYYAARTVNPMGGDFRPLGGDLFGVESGMLAASAKASAGPDGAWRVFFASPRGVADRKSGRSAVQRVFSRIPFWSAAAMKQPRIQESLRQVQAGLLASRRAQAINLLTKTIRLTKSIAREAEAVATTEAVGE